MGVYIYISGGRPGGRAAGLKRPPEAPGPVEAANVKKKNQKQGFCGPAPKLGFLMTLGPQISTFVSFPVMPQNELIYW